MSCPTPPGKDFLTVYRLFFLSVDRGTYLGRVDLETLLCVTLITHHTILLFETFRTNSLPLSTDNVFEPILFGPPRRFILISLGS